MMNQLYMGRDTHWRHTDAGLYEDINGSFDAKGLVHMGFEGRHWEWRLWSFDACFCKGWGVGVSRSPRWRIRAAVSLESRSYKTQFLPELRRPNVSTLAWTSLASRDRMKNLHQTWVSIVWGIGCHQGRIALKMMYRTGVQAQCNSSAKCTLRSK